MWRHGSTKATQSGKTKQRNYRGRCYYSIFGPNFLFFLKKPKKAK